MEDEFNNATASSDIEKQSTESLLCLYIYTGWPNTHSRILNKSKKKCTRYWTIRQKIIYIIKTNQTSKASGSANIDHRLLKPVAISISTPLIILFNMSLTTSTVQEKWKLAL